MFRRRLLVTLPRPRRIHPVAMERLNPAIRLCRQSLTRPSATLSPSDGERDGVRGTTGLWTRDFRLHRKPDVTSPQSLTPQRMAVSTESCNRTRTFSSITSRSTTASIVCACLASNFTRTFGSVSSTNSPSTRARMKPSRCNRSITSRNSPFAAHHRREQHHFWSAPAMRGFCPRYRSWSAPRWVRPCRTMRLSDMRVEQPQVIVNLRRGSDRRTQFITARALLMAMAGRDLNNPPGFASESRNCCA